MVLKQDSSYGWGQNDPQIESQIHKAVGLFPVFGGAQVCYQCVIGRIFHCLKDSCCKKQQDLCHGYRKNRCCQVTDDRYQIADNDELFLIAAVCQLSSQQVCRKLYHSHSYGDLGDLLCIHSQLIA